MKKITLTFPDQDHDTRPETGIAFKDGDWSGVFIRGDNAFALSRALHFIINNPDVYDKLLYDGVCEIFDLLIKPSIDTMFAGPPKIRDEENQNAATQNVTQVWERTRKRTC